MDDYSYIIVRSDPSVGIDKNNMDDVNDDGG